MSGSDLVVTLRNPDRTQFKVISTGETDANGFACAALLIFDGDVRGPYIANAVVDLAREYGWPDAPARVDTACGDLYEEIDLARADAYLCESVAPTGWYFGFANSGSYFFANDPWWSLEE